MDRLEPGKVEATAAAQMDEEVPSVSGSHGNLADRHHRRIVGRELSERNDRFNTFHLPLDATAKQAEDKSASQT